MKSSVMKDFHGKKWRNKLKKMIEELLLADKEKM